MPYANYFALRAVSLNWKPLKTMLKSDIRWKHILPKRFHFKYLSC